MPYNQLSGPWKESTHTSQVCILPLGSAFVFVASYFVGSRQMYLFSSELFA